MALNQSEIEEYQQTHLDKLVGIFTEPITTFEKTAKFPLKTPDWLIPVILVILTSSMSIVVMLSNPKIKYQVIEERAAMVRAEVLNGDLTPEEGEEKIEKIRSFLEGSYGTFAPLSGIVFGGFAIFLLIAFVFMILSKFLMKGEINYKGALIACGLPQYILILQIIITVIVALTMGKFMDSLSLAAFLDLDKSSIEYLLLNKLDLFQIWFYLILSFGLAKLSNSAKLGRYVVLVFGVWIGFSLVWHYISKLLPFLS